MIVNKLFTSLRRSSKFIRQQQQYTSLRLMSTQPKKIVEQAKTIKHVDKKQAYDVSSNQQDEEIGNPMQHFWNLKIDQIKKGQVKITPSSVMKTDDPISPQKETVPQEEQQQQEDDDVPKSKQEKKPKQERRVKVKKEAQVMSEEAKEDEALNKTIDYKSLSCTGCGVKLQYEEPESIGYLPKIKVLQHYKKEKHHQEFMKLQEENQKMQDKNNNRNIIEYLRDKNVSQEVLMELQRSQVDPSKPPEILDIEALLELDELASQQPGDNQIIKNFTNITRDDKTIHDIQKKPNNLICQRCFHLKHLNQLLDYKGPPSNYAGSPTNLSGHVHKMNRDQILKSILSQIYAKSIIIMVIDIANFEGSQIEEIFQNVNQKKHRLLLVCNKIDALPSGMDVERVQNWVKDQVKDKLNRDIVYNICLTSAKKATGIAKVVDILEKIKKDFEMGKYLPKVYVVGSTNSGKSSFINALIYRSNRYKDPNKILYRSKFDVLTESPAPGTTMEMISVDDVRLGYKFLDTPGIPNLNQVSSLIEDFQDLITILPNKQISSYPVNIKPAYSVWLGALARMDFLSGEDKYFTFFVPPNVTIHRTPILKADQVYEKQAGVLLRPAYNSKPESIVFEKHELALNCDDYKLANFDVSIEGLGWFSVQGKGFINMLLHLPKGVKYHIREDPIFPYEVLDKGLKRYTGNPVNSYTKKNKQLAQKFKVRKDMNKSENEREY